MASLIRSLRKTQLITKSISYHKTERKPSLFTFSAKNPVSQISRRNYISEMRKSAFEGKISRLLRNEIQYELDRAPAKQPITKFNSFTVDDRPGEQWVRLTRTYGENEDIKVEATMFDGSIPVSKDVGEEVKLHITLIVNISKGEGEILEIVCSAWPDSIEITNLFIRRNAKMSAQPYVGPGFEELDDDLQDSLYEYLEERGIDEQLTSFLHECMKNKDKTEYIRWMETVKSYIEKN